MGENHVNWMGSDVIGGWSRDQVAEGKAYVTYHVI